MPDVPPTDESGRARTWRAIVIVIAVLAALGVGGVWLWRTQQHSTSAACDRLGELADLDAVLASGDLPQLAAQRQRLRAASEVAPDEIAPALLLLAEITDDLARTMGTTRDPAQATAEVATRRREQLADIEAAGSRVEAYGLANCGVTLGSAPRGSVPGSAVPTTAVAATTAATTVRTTTSAARPTPSSTTTGLRPTTAPPSSTSTTAPTPRPPGAR